MRRTDAEILKRCRLPEDGVFGDFTFTRNTRVGYWVVKGAVPLAVAEDLYADPLGHEDVRVAGHCGNPAPEDPWITWRSASGRVLAPKKSKADFAAMVDRGVMPQEIMDGYLFSDDRSKATPTIDLYHIDSEAGLRLFADKIRGLKVWTVTSLLDRQFNQVVGVYDSPQKARSAVKALTADLPHLSMLYGVTKEYAVQ